MCLYHHCRSAGAHLIRPQKKLLSDWILVCWCVGASPLAPLSSSCFLRWVIDGKCGYFPFFHITPKKGKLVLALFSPFTLILVACSVVFLFFGWGQLQHTFSSQQIAHISSKNNGKITLTFLLSDKFSRPLLSPISPLFFLVCCSLTLFYNKLFFYMLYTR